MAYDAGRARVELLDDLAVATDALGRALAALGEAYEQLDERTADTLEEQLFGPVQKAYGRAQRTHAGFAERFGLPGRTFAPGTGGPPARGARGFVEAAPAGAAEADARIAELQDSMRPVEVGDAELRAGLSEVRRLIADVPAHARALIRVLGRQAAPCACSFTSRRSEGRRVQQRHVVVAVPAGPEDRDERRRRDEHRSFPGRPGDPALVAARRPAQERVATDEPRGAVAQDERAVGQVVERGVVVALGAAAVGQALAVQARVDRIGAALAVVELRPERAEAVVVGAAAE